MALIHLCFGGNSPLGYVKKKTKYSYFFCHNCIIKHNDSTKQDNNLEGFSQYISKYMALKI